ncbi:MAG TPA: tRNA (adenosine(37)-N6)-threonylcarbamoyltransferase complex ATPase subunit type 1 TsaE [Acidimicrobiales bacterium]|nr:tRNA (adenosine(37)-N6)-threonylcarbamoyltransferase complex ATPase subunit type 1 TsaE [Acidimicrobiales bacterium]
MSWSLRAQSESPDATRALAERLAGAARRGDVVVLQGTLGAGKTTFAQGFARGLGVAGPVTSPTFTLVRQYPCALGQLVHVDVYRLEHLAEVADLGLADLVDDGVALVEWGDVARPALGAVTWTVGISRPAGEGPGDGDGDADDDRELSVSGEDDSRRAEVAAALGAG